MCLFCEKLHQKDEWIYDNQFFYVIKDQYPVSLGHLLIIPKRHIVNYFSMTTEEATMLHVTILETKKMLDFAYSPDGYNIGVNNGEAAGQSIFHLHIHLIPRYKGDVSSPRGGVRGVIPGKRDY